MFDNAEPVFSASTFWDFVDVGSDDECWLWKRGKDAGGYGRHWPIRPGGSQIASRTAYELHHGVALDDPAIKVRHTCDNSGCVNPAHLILGSQSDNIRDRQDRGRTRNGSHPSRLTQVEVDDIVRRRVDGETLTSIATRYSCDPSYVSRIARGIRTPCPR